MESQFMGWVHSVITFSILIQEIDDHPAGGVQSRAT